MNAINLDILCHGKGIEWETFCDYADALGQVETKHDGKEREIDTLENLVRKLKEAGANTSDFDHFFYGFSIPQISKEFDLLKIYGSGQEAGEVPGTVVNIELKSQKYEKENQKKIKKQLKQNRHYLSHLGREIVSFCYVMADPEPIVYRYYGDSDRLLRSSVRKILEQITLKKPCMDCGIESLFHAKDYLLSPINQPERFLNGSYFLTNLQENIKKEIITGITEEKGKIWGITGTAGTGKTLLLYDIARNLAESKGAGKVCVVHSGTLSEGHFALKEKWEGVRLISAKERELPPGTEYVFVDEAQRLYYEKNLVPLMEKVDEKEISCVFSYDREQTFRKTSKSDDIPEKIKKHQGFVKEEKLKKTIRTNSEIMSFIGKVTNLNLTFDPKERASHNIEVLFASKVDAAKEIVEYYVQNKKYKFINYPVPWNGSDFAEFSDYEDTQKIVGQEFDYVMVPMDDHFFYDEHGELKANPPKDYDFDLVKLWYQGATRAREKLCILVIENEPLFKNILHAMTKGEESKRAKTKGA